MEIPKINAALESETNCNIKPAAEVHLNLSRKLDEAIHLSSGTKAKNPRYLHKHISGPTRAL